MVKKKKILVIVLLMTVLAAVQAQETVADETPVMALFPQYGAGQMFNITPFAYPSSFGGRLGTGLLNIFFGLGSWISGDWQGGLLITLMQGGGIGITLFAISWLSDMDKAEQIVFGILPIALGIIGVGVWGYGIVAGFIAPFTQPKTAQLNDPRNWTVAVLPTPNGRVAGALAFTAHF